MTELGWLGPSLLDPDNRSHPDLGANGRPGALDFDTGNEAAAGPPTALGKQLTR